MHDSDSHRYASGSAVKGESASLRCEAGESAAGLTRMRQTRSTPSSVRSNDGPALNLTVVEEVVRLARAPQREVLDQHLDFSSLGEADHLHQLGGVSPIG